MRRLLLFSGFPALLASGFLASCASEPEPIHPWLDLSDATEHEIVEVSGATSGQLVIVVPPGTTRDAVMDLAGRIAEQIPPNSTANARIFNDLATALNWRTAPAELTVDHLLVVVTHLPGDGTADVRWMPPDAEVPTPEPGTAGSDSVVAPDPSGGD